MANTKKINVTLAVDDLAEIDEYVSAHAMTRSGFLVLAAKQYIMSMQALPKIADLMSAMTGLAQRLDQMTKEEAEAAIADIEQQRDALLGQR